MCSWTSCKAKLNHGLRSEILDWSYFRTGVRLPSPPPDYLPSIDKRNFVNRWFFVYPKVLDLSRFRALCFLPCSNSWCFRIAVFGLYLTQTYSCQVLTFNDLTSGGVHLLTICLVIVKRYCYGKKTARRFAGCP